MRIHFPLSRCFEGGVRCSRVLLAIAAVAFSTPSYAAGTPCAKVDAGYTFDDSARGAFGPAPAVQACIDVLRAPHDGPRRLRIFVEGRQVLSNDAVALGPNDGGADGDPFQPLAVRSGSLIVQNEGGGGPLSWTETWHLTIRNGLWIVAGWDNDATDTHSAADDGGEFHTSVNALTGDVHDSYDPPEGDAAKPAVHRVCKLPPEWRSPPVAKVAAIRDRNWRCDAQFGKPLRSGNQATAK
jgi:hypothetical protein